MLRKYSTYIFCFLLSLLVVALYVNDFSFMKSIEWSLQDLMYSFKSDNPRYNDIQLVNVDNRTLSGFGEWPWTWDKIADLVAAVGHGEPKTILLDIPLDQHTQSNDSVDFADILAGQLSWVNNVIVPFEFTPAEYIIGKIYNPPYLFNSSIEVNSDIGILEEHQSLLAKKVFLPPDKVCEYVAGFGFNANAFDSDRIMRWQPLVTHFQGYYYPSASLMAAAHYKNVPASLIMVYGGEKIQMGSTEIPTDAEGRLFINYNKPKSSFPIISAADILNEKYNFENLKNKLVIISISDDLLAEYYKTPVDDQLMAYEKTANVVENIIHTNFITRMDATPGIDILILIGMGLVFAFALPKLSMVYRLVVIGVTFVVITNVSFFLFNSSNIMTRPLYLYMELFFFLLAIPFLDKDFFEKFTHLHIGFDEEASGNVLPKVELPKSHVINSKKRKQKVEDVEIESTVLTDDSSKTQLNMDSGGTQAGQDTIIDGPEISSTTAIEDSSKKVGEISNVSKPAESQQPFDHQTRNIDEEKDVEAKADKLDSGGINIEGDPGSSDSSIDIGSGPVNIKNLGRYKVIGVLGKGAMGTVYKGVDPAIDRNVALKTIRLDFVNDPSELEELKERLSREAKAAGMLSHPNIVTIYDVGSEGSLQYIAMEYLQGQTLEDMIRKKVKFNYRIISQIITQICTALDFAHNQGIVHRDIKPANIMVTNDYRVKVMDFGIARVDSSSMTRTGIAMGTPNYISPEQLQGKPVDKRCDIFSLGVLMYEMLLQRRPFRGENLTSLIYNIVNGEVELPSKVNKAIPLIFDRIIEKALAKDPANRYQHASEIAANLSDFIESFAAKR
ncbi:MAG: serine/threonine-protein kinase [Candidatus Zixiibacteriota bacterium]